MALPDVKFIIRCRYAFFSAVSRLGISGFPQTIPCKVPHIPPKPATQGAGSPIFICPPGYFQFKLLKAEAILRKSGISVAYAYEWFYRQIIAHHGLPYDNDLPSETTILAIEEARQGKGAAHEIGPPMTYAHKKIPETGRSAKMDMPRP
ncbi:MAG: hypothetical protein DRI57_23230 [Deltaproteobacteria bacterium]|nr:MAG: hypothetical protein DRI57_23230 [Deltaproteobacteria bacterium]